MSDPNNNEGTGTPPDLKTIYPNSGVRLPSPDPAPAPPVVDFDQQLYARLISEGRTPEYAKEQAEQSTLVQNVYRGKGKR
jgi:hypothetical protein